jgi:hypothetical protein
MLRFIASMRFSWASVHRTLVSVRASVQGEVCPAEAGSGEGGLPSQRDYLLARGAFMAPSPAISHRPLTRTSV